MKRTTSSRNLTSKQVKEAIAAAPDAVTDANTPYNPNDAASVATFWKGAVVTKGGGVAAVTAALAARRKQQMVFGVRQADRLQALLKDLDWTGLLVGRFTCPPAQSQPIAHEGRRRRDGLAEFVGPGWRQNHFSLKANLGIVIFSHSMEDRPHGRQRA